MGTEEIRNKFGGDFIADDKTFKMGIHRRFTSHIAGRFSGKTVLETCSGAGFSTISLAETAAKVISVDIKKDHLEQAKGNVEKADRSENVIFIHGDVLDEKLFNKIPGFDAAFLDPDWADTGPDHVYSFINSNTKPPADVLLKKVFEYTENIALILPPYISTEEFKGLPEHECEKLYMGESHELFCLWFGDFIYSKGITEFKVLL